MHLHSIANSLSFRISIIATSKHHYEVITGIMQYKCQSDENTLQHIEYKPNSTLGSKTALM